MAIYEANGQKYEIPDDVQGDKLIETLTLLTAQESANQPIGKTETVTIPEGPVQSPNIPPPQAIKPPSAPTLSSVIEPAATVASGIVAEPVAGLAGLVSLPFTDVDQATENIEKVRQALTFVPKTKEGMQALQKVAETLQPVGEAFQKAEEFTGDIGAGVAGPTGGAIGATIPAAAMSALGYGPVRNIIGVGKLTDLSKKMATGSARTLLKTAAPTIEGLKDAARGIYDELDNLGAVVSPNATSRLGSELINTAKKEGFNKRIHQKIAATLQEFEDVAGTPQKLSNIDTLRKVAQAAAASIEPSEARLGSILINKVDDFLDNATPKDFIKGNAKDIGAKFKDARQLWQRAKKSELLSDAFTKAQNQASGFENGLRTQFRSILNNKKKLRGFTKEEIAAMNQVVRGGAAENIAKAIGKFGFTEGQATSMLLSSMGVAGGAAVGGAPGAVAVPVIGQVSKKLAQKLTRNNAELADAIVRSGKNGTKIVSNYMKSVPAKERDVAELTELLIKQNLNTKQIKAIPISNKLAKDAVFFASFIQSQKEKK